MSSTSTEILTADLNHLQELLIRFFADIENADLNRHTERNDRGWTLHETLAHVTAVAEVFYQALDCAVSGGSFAYPGLEKRTDLPIVNQREIAARVHVSAKTLIETLLYTLNQTAKRTQTLTESQLALPVNIAAYNRPLTVAEVIGGQLTHLGIVHAAQLANGTEVRPLWVHYSADFMQRQLTHFFVLMSHAYWPERNTGGNQHVAINFNAGMKEFTWHVTLNPDGGTTGQGPFQHPALRIWTPTPEALCNIVTWQYSSLTEALFKRQVLAWGNLPLAFKMGYLFAN